MSNRYSDETLIDGKERTETAETPQMHEEISSYIISV